MSKMSKQVGYLKGLIDAAPLDESKLENKLLMGIIELLGELSDRAEDVDDLLQDLNDYVESIDDDLSALEGEGASPFSIFDKDDDEYEDDEDDDFGDGFDFPEDQLHILRPEVPAAPQSMPMLGATCPDCLRLFFVSPDDPADAMYTCPHCGKQIRPVPFSSMNAPVVSPEKDD